MVQKNVAEILKDHMNLELEGIDRMYLNGYVPSLQTGAGFTYFVREQLGFPIASTAMIAPMNRAFVSRIEQFVAEAGVDLVSFRKGERKGDVAQAYLRAFEGEEGVLFVGKAQEKASVLRTEKRTNEAGVKYPWVIRSTAMVLPAGPRLRAAVHQVLRVFPVWGEGLPERARVAEAPARETGHGL